MKVALVIMGCIFMLVAIVCFIGGGSHYTWTPPFSQYEVGTMASGIIGIILFCVGMNNE